MNEKLVNNKDLSYYRCLYTDSMLGAPNDVIVKELKQFIIDMMDVLEQSDEEQIVLDMYEIIKDK